MSRDPTAERLTGYLAAIAKKYPGVWGTIDDMRRDRGIGLPDWAPWCFLPLAGAAAIASRGQDVTGLDPRTLLSIQADISVVGALAAWRPTQGIYRFHPNMLEALWATPVTGDLPIDLLFRLPEWCIYVETPQKSFLQKKLHGFFVHLEEDAQDRRCELRFLLDGENELAPLILHLSGKTIPGALEKSFAESKTMARKLTLNMPAITDELQRDIAREAESLVSLLLYLCSLNAELRDARGIKAAPFKPKVKHTKKGERLFPAERQTFWEVGYRIGSALGRKLADSERRSAANAGGHASPSPHIRRAHWHSFWTGPMKDPEGRELVLKWLPPIPVNIEETEELIPTIRPVR